MLKCIFSVKMSCFFVYNTIPNSFSNNIFKQYKNKSLYLIKMHSLLKKRPKFSLKEVRSSVITSQIISYLVVLAEVVGTDSIANWLVSSTCILLDNNAADIFCWLVSVLASGSRENDTAFSIGRYGNVLKIVPKCCGIYHRIKSLEN